MATVTARKVDDEEYRILAEIAERNSRSVSSELRDLISERVRRYRIDKSIEEMRDIRRKTKGKLGPYPDSVALIHAIRDEG